jgi:hypothetical protein
VTIQSASGTLDAVVTPLPFIRGSAPTAAPTGAAGSAPRPLAES